jgi:hypothetical protein
MEPYDLRPQSLGVGRQVLVSLVTIVILLAISAAATFTAKSITPHENSCMTFTTPVPLRDVGRCQSGEGRSGHGQIKS